MSKSESTGGPGTQETEDKTLQALKEALSDTDAPAVALGAVDNKTGLSRQTIHDRLDDLVEKYPHVCRAKIGGHNAYWVATDAEGDIPEQVIDAHYTALGEMATRVANRFGFLFFIFTIITGLVYFTPAPQWTKTALVSLSVVLLVLYMLVATFAWRYGEFMNQQFKSMYGPLLDE